METYKIVSGKYQSDVAPTLYKPSVHVTRGVMVCDKSAAGFRRFCDFLTTENDVISEKET